MADLRSRFQRLLFGGLKSWIDGGYREKPQQWSQWMREIPSTSAFEEYFRSVGIGLFNEMAEEGEYPQDQFDPELSVRFNHLKFGKKIGFPEEFIDDQKYDVAQRRGRELGFSARQTMEVLFADILNSGFTTNGYDGVPLFSASHPLGKGGSNRVQSNILATPANLDVVSYRIMLTMFRRFVDGTGERKIQLDPMWLIAPPEEEWNADEITKSAGRPDTANRADNVTQGKTKTFVYDYLTDVNNWFISCGPRDIQIYAFIRSKFSTSTYFDEDTDVNWVKAKMRFTQGYTDYIGIVGANPV